MLELSGDYAAAVEHKIFSDDSAEIREPVGELFVRRKQKQPWRLGSIRANHYCLGLLQVRVSLLIEVHRANRSPIGVRLNPVNVRIRPNLAAASLLRHPNGRGQRTRLRPDFAPKSKTESAINATASPSAPLRIDRHGRRVTMPAQLSSRPLET